MAVILQMTFSNAFSWMKINALQVQVHWSLFNMPNGIISIDSGDGLMLSGNKLLLETLLTHWPLGDLNKGLDK